MASGRYRAVEPARWLGASINDPSADVLVFSKPQPHELCLMGGKRVVVDFCDDHFDRFPHYREFLRRAELITCPTEVMRQRIAELGRDAFVIPEAYAYDEAEPHCNGVNLLWFGNPVNLGSLEAVKRQLEGYPLTVWAPKVFDADALLANLARADIVVIPKTAAYKSANRAVEAVRRGCFVVAELHPSLNDFPVWIGDLKEGIEWARANPAKAREMTRCAQNYVRKRLSPRTLASAWRTVIQALS